MGRSVVVKLGADVTDLKAKLAEGGRSVRAFTKEMDQAAKAGHLDAVADQAGLAGAAVAGLAGYAIKASMDFDKAMSAVSAGTNATAKDLDSLREAALQAGKDTQYSATEAAKGITELGKAGVSTQAILNGGLKGALALAAAGQMDVAEAAELSASAMTQFKLSGDKVPHIADLLAAAAGKAQGSVHDMGMALNQAGLVSAQTGLTIEETTGGLAAFANAGLTGSDAGTSFKQMLLMLQAPAGKTKELMDELGISAYDSQGEFIGLANLAGQLKTQLKDLTPEQRASAMATIFGADAVRGASILYEQGSAGIETWIGKVNDAGYASETAAKLTDNLAGDIERLKGNLETMAIEAGSGANGGLRVLVKSVSALVDQFSSLPPFMGSTVTILGAVGGAALLGATGWVKMRRATTDALEELRQTGPVGTRAAGGLQTVGKYAGAAAAAFVALQVASAAVSAMQEDLNPQVEALGTGLEKWGQGAALSGEAARLLGGDMSHLKDTFKFLADEDNSRRQAVKNMQGVFEAVVPGLDGASESLTQTKERVASLDSALVSLVQGGKTGEAATAFQKLQNELAVGGVTVDEVKAKFPQYAAALEVAAGASGKAAAGATGAAAALSGLPGAAEGAEGATKEYTSAADAAAAAARGQRDALVDLSNRMQAEADPVFGLINAQRELKTAQDAAAKAVRDHGHDSEQAKTATQKLALAAIELQGKAGALGETFDGKLSPSMRATLKAANLTDAQIKDVEASFTEAKQAGDTYDGKYSALVSAPGAGKAKTEIAEAWTEAKGFAGPYRADIKVAGDVEAMRKLERLLVAQQAAKKGISISAAQSAFNKNAYADGGWTGPGAMYDEAGVVHADEFVVKKASRQRFEREHPGVLDHVNQTGELPPGYAGGGIVMPYRINAAATKVISMAEALAKVAPQFSKDWPPSPAAQRGDSGVWKQVLALIKSGPKQGSFGNSYRPGDPRWHGSGRAVDWMGFNMDALAGYLASKGPLELIHRTNSRDYAYTRGRNMGSFNESLMNAHRNHIHIAMADGGVINEHVIGVGRSGATYEFGERGPETVTPGYALGGLVNFAPRTSTVSSAPTRGSKLDTAQAALAARDAVAALTQALKENGRVWDQNKAKGRDNRQSLISGVKAAQDAARAKYAETGSITAANKVYRQYIASLDNAMKKMKVSASLRKALIRAYSEQPKYDLPDPAPARAPFNSANRIAAKQGEIGALSALDSIKKAFAWTKPTFNSKTETGRAELAELFSYLNAAQTAAQSNFDSTGSKAGAMKIYNQALAQLRALLISRGNLAKNVDKMLSWYGKITLTPRENRWGGLYEHMAGGGLREAQIAAGGPTRYAWAEAATGGELFAPKRGNLAKTRAEVGWAVNNWWGGQVSWGGRGGGKMTLEAPIVIHLGSETITRQVRLEVDAAVGEIASATVYETA